MPAALCVGALSLSAGGCQLLLDDLPPTDAAVPANVDASNGDASMAVPVDASPVDASDATLIDASSPSDAMAEDADAALFPQDTSLPDADPDACDGAGQGVFFEDRDNDGYGDSRAFQIACVAPDHFVTAGEDCHDDNPDVNPGQTGFFGQGYEVRNSDKISFDYDCDGDETGREDQVVASASGCTGVLPCAGGGYMAIGPRRNVPHANDHCGSTRILVCGFGALVCNGMESEADEPYSCR